MNEREDPKGIKRILWVEDEYYHLRGLVKPLVDAGFEVVPARSRVEAEQLLEDWRSFGLILLDLIIPYSDLEPIESHPTVTSIRDVGSGNIHSLITNGFALFDYMTKELKVDIPIVVLSVVQAEDVRNMLLRGGAAAFVVKKGLIPRDVMRIVTDTIEGLKEPEPGGS